MAAALHTDKYPCIKCAEHFKAANELVDHLQNSHGLTKPFLCDRCPNSFESRDSLLAHFDEDHRDWKVFTMSTCGICCNILSNNEQLERHMKHDHPKPKGAERVCTVCGFTNDSFVGISLHFLHEHAVVGTCQWCGKAFAEKFNLNLHKKECRARPQPVPEPLRQPALTPAVQAAQAPSLSLPTLALPPAPLTQDEYLPPAAGFAPDLQQTGVEGLCFKPVPSSIHHTENEEQFKTVKFFSSTQIRYNGWLFDLHKDFNPQTLWDDTHPSKKTYRECPPAPCVSDALLFHAEPRMLAYSNILRLAICHSNPDVVQKANAGRPEGKPVFKTVQALESRLNSAYKWSAEQRTNAGDPHTAQQVKENILRLREQNGIFKRVARKRNAVNLEVGAVTTGPVKKGDEPPAKRRKGDSAGLGSAVGGPASPDLDLDLADTGFDFGGGEYGPYQGHLPYYQQRDFR